MSTSIEGILSRLLGGSDKVIGSGMCNLKGWAQTRENNSILSLVKTYSFSDRTTCLALIVHILNLHHSTGIHVSADKFEKEDRHGIDVKIECPSDMLKTAQEIAANIDSTLSDNTNGSSEKEEEENESSTSKG